MTVPDQADRLSRKPGRNLVPVSLIILCAFMGLATAFERTKPVVKNREVTDRAKIVAMERVLGEVETEDGKKVKAWVFVPVEKTTEVKKVEQVTEQPTEKQRLAFTIIAAFFLFCLVLAAGLLVLFFWALFRGQEPPKIVASWLWYFAAGMLGAVLLFVGYPTGSPQVEVKPAPHEKAIEHQPKEGQQKP